MNGAEGRVPVGAAPVLELDHVTVRYGTRTVLSDVSFTVGTGEMVAVIGPNGAGKSTLFRAVTGLVPHEGHVIIGGHPCHHRRDHVGAAYIPQRTDVDLDFPITVSQLVLSGRRRFLHLGRRPSAVDRRVAREAIEQVGLGGLDGRPIGTLSGGQLQRAFVARALAQEAGVVLLDEALSGVDEPSTAQLLDLFTQLRDAGTTLMIATHDLALARRRFDRCLALNGRLVADGPPATALDGDRLEATFGSARLPGDAA